jgi:hypothetical protein
MITLGVKEQDEGTRKLNAQCSMTDEPNDDRIEYLYYGRPTGQSIMKAVCLPIIPSWYLLTTTLTIILR